MFKRQCGFYATTVLADRQQNPAKSTPNSVHMSERENNMCAAGASVAELPPRRGPMSAVAANRPIVPISHSTPTPDESILGDTCIDWNVPTTAFFAACWCCPQYSHSEPFALFHGAKLLGRECAIFMYIMMLCYVAALHICTCCASAGDTFAPQIR